MKLSEKKKEVKKIGIILILINISLFLIKWVSTLFFPSISVEADAFNSLGDFGYSILFILGLNLLFTPKDKSHPHGHERIEPLISMIVASAIGITGIFVVMRAIQSLYKPTYTFSFYLVIVLLISAFSKWALSKYLGKKSEKLDSTALESSSKDSKVDVLASLTALSGVIGAKFGFVVLDPVLGFAVSFWIFKTAYSIGKRSFIFLTGGAPSKKVLDEIRKVLEGKEEVISYHDLEAHYVGPEIHVSVSVRLPEGSNFDEVHEMEEELMEEIKCIEDIECVYIHLEPEKSS